MEYSAKTTSQAENAENMGILPARAPLANPYVPLQKNTDGTYLPAQGMVRGTMFSGLDLPLMGKGNHELKTQTLSHQLQAYQFAMTELGLYLDTHKDDKEALQLFRAYKEALDECIAKYEADVGPLTQAQSAHRETYDWMSDPWPWDYQQKEG